MSPAFSIISELAVQPLFNLNKRSSALTYMIFPFLCFLLALDINMLRKRDENVFGTSKCNVCLKMFDICAFTNFFDSLVMYQVSPPNLSINLFLLNIFNLYL